MTKHWTCLQAEQMELASVQEEKARMTLIGRTELSFTKMVGEAGMGKCRKCKELWFSHVKFKVSTRQGSWETE